MAASEIRIRVPHPSSMLLLNVLGVLGLVAVVVAVGGLAGWLFGLLVAGVAMVGLCLIGYTHELAKAVADQAPVAEAGAAPAVAAVPRSA